MFPSRLAASRRTLRFLLSLIISRHFTMSKKLPLALLLLSATGGFAQQSLTTARVAVTQNFDSLGSSASATLAINGGNLEYTYSRSTGAKDNGVTYQIEWSDTLEAGSWSKENVTEQIQGTQGALEAVKATIPAGSGGKRFLRLRVEGAAAN